MRTLYRASVVHTLGHPERGEWLLVDERHIRRVGSGEPPDAHRVVDLPGTTIVPGFIDAHVHLTGTGIALAHPEARQSRSAEELVVAVRKAAAGREVTLVHGFDESTWAAPDLPRVRDLDSVDGAVVVVRADGHLSLANTQALDRSGAFEASGLERDDASDVSVARAEANERLQAWSAQQLTDSDVELLQLEAASLAASRGVTCVHEMSVPQWRGTRDLAVLLEHRARLPVAVVPYVATTDIPFVMDLGLTRIGGDLSLDGSIGARTAHLSEPYAVGEGDVGLAYLDDDSLFEFLHSAHLAGLQAGLHVIGDAAIEQAVGCWERVYRSLDSRQRRHFRARRHRLEHFEMPSEDHLERAAMLGLAISVQPAFDEIWGAPGRLYEQRLGEDRAIRMNPFRALLDRGLSVGAGSDAPITPLDPMRGIAALENHHDAAQRLSRHEAIRLFTIGSAQLAHQEDKKGRLEPGFHADFAAYDGDPFEAAHLERLRPVLTVSGGRDVSAQ